jgi:hypothetical protein
MRVNRKDYSQLMAHSLSSLPTPDSLSSKLGERVLILEYPPAHLPGLGVIILSSTSKDKIFKHLLAKWVIGGYLRKSERLVGAMLIAQNSNLRNSIILDFMISHKINKFERRKDLWNELLPLVLHLPIDPLSYLNAFEPEIFICRKWYDRKRFPAKRYVGIGYSDHGHLSTTLAWQEQMIGGEEVELPSAEVRSILSHFMEDSSPSRGSY